MSMIDLVKQSPGPVRLSVPAQPGFTHVIRSVAASVAARHGLRLDAVDEIRLVVDEAAALLLDVHAPAHAFTLVIATRPASFDALLSTDAQAADWPPPGVEESWAWRVVSGLADEARFDFSEKGEPGIRIVKRLVPASE